MLTQRIEAYIARSAISLLELLVVIAILAVLAALTLAGVQRVRATAARAQCANQLRQLALAIDQYHISQKRLPPGFIPEDVSGDRPYLGWPARLLPYLEQDAIWRKVEEAFRTDPKPLVFYGHKPHADLLETVVLAFICPADYHARTPHEFPTGRVAFTSYLGVSGTNYVQKNGVLFAGSRLTHADVRDGLSHTLLIGERPPSADFRLGWWYRGWGLYKDGTAEMVLGVRERNFSSDYTSCPKGPYKFTAGRLSNECDLFHFWSLHPGGGNFAFADGSVRFLAYSADSILPALATRAGGEVVSLD
jgi:prepilin-type processing-associated H-X9-DG protein